MIFDIPNLTVGIHSLSAAYAGDKNYSASSSTTVLQTIALARVPSNISLYTSRSSITYGEPLQVWGTVTGSGPNPTGTVTLFDGSNPISSGTINGNAVIFDIPNLTVGIHSLTAAYAGDASHFASSSTVVTQIVTPV